ncbi:hypothetical protein [Ascidiimonas aurantiaca]|uniref:hypothetical protein n=1 Tax=Ascidiimonas aurantiaca TaxID=1685432 RepID=UPI0030EB61CB
MKKLRTDLLYGLSRNFLRRIAGGTKVICISGCYTPYLGGREEGSPCAFAGASGGICYGTVTNGKCCT